MKVFQRETQLRTSGGLTVTDITEEVHDAVRESGVREGIVCIYSPHTTCCVRVNEYERGMFEDFTSLLRRLVPSAAETYYAHDDWDRRTENICEEDMDAPRETDRQETGRPCSIAALTRPRPHPSEGASGRSSRSAGSA